MRRLRDIADSVREQLAGAEEERDVDLLDALAGVRRRLLVEHAL